MMESRRMRWIGHVAHIGEKRNVYRILMGRSEEKRTLERSRGKRENNIKWILERWGWGSVRRIDLAHDRDQWRALLNTVMNHRFK
jgi:hypothetical protein